ncbi:sulfatase [Haloarcula pelagica]|uniref:sulfatase n=1 Tax=Haloarcula pelagica TaxID=3033389 RepID=UPI0024C28ABA|nr:sulfatase [Halomicroarcula sp. YJ-61-S]
MSPVFDRGAMTDRPDVLFLVVDSVRKDRTSTYGHDRETTPNLDALADVATRYDSAYVPAPWTLPSHCSMFTGLAPSEHGVTGGFADSTSRLPEATPTLTERLSEAGYRTAGFSNNPWVGSLSGLDRGFEEFVEWDLELTSRGGLGVHRRRDRMLSAAHRLLAQAARQPVFLLKRRFFTDRLVDRAERWFARTAPLSAPTFTFLNLMEAHSPYFPPRSAFRALDLDPPSVVEPRLLNTKLLAYVLGRRDLAPAERRRVMEYYDASLRYQDRRVEELLAALRHQGRFDETLIVVCADHGKTLGEYDRDGTPPHYTRQLNVTVPLLVKAPGQSSSERVEAPVELADVFDLLVGAGTEADGDGLRPDPSGTALVEDFLPHTGGEEPADRERWRVLADGVHKYVTDGDREFLFDVRADRDEQLKDPGPDRLESFRTALRDRVADLDTAAAGESRSIGKSTQSQLQDLGYM